MLIIYLMKKLIGMSFVQHNMLNYSADVAKLALNPLFSGARNGVVWSSELAKNNNDIVELLSQYYLETA